MSSFVLDEVAIYSATLGLARIQAHYAARTTLGYAAAVLADSPVGYWRLGTPAQQALTSWPHKPLTVEIAGECWRQYLRVDSLEVDDTLGQPVTASFTVVNPTAPPVVGNTVRVLWYDYVLFAGTIDRVEKSLNLPMTVTQYACECADWSQILVRRKISRNFTNISLQGLAENVLGLELAGEGLSLGTCDTRSTMPMADAQEARVFDLFRDAAGIAGQTFFVGFDKTLQFRSTTVEDAPTPLSPASLESLTGTTDRETYRNAQTVIAEGTPVAQEAAVTATVVKENADQIAERAALEGGSGRYEEIEKLTHPTSNAPADVRLLAFGYAQLRLATSGALRRTVKCRVRGWGFRAGQVVTLNVPQVDAVGEWIVQRAALAEQDGHSLLYDLELTTSSLQQRAYESWLAMVKKGKIVITPPGFEFAHRITYDTAGTYSFTVPAGVTVIRVTCSGASGGGGGSHYALRADIPINPVLGPYEGGVGGNGGLAYRLLDVFPGEALTVIVGAGGSPGVNASWINLVYDPATGWSWTYTEGTVGSIGTVTSINRGALELCQANPGTGGGVGYEGWGWHFTGAPGSPGTGIGDAVTVGGGQLGGIGGAYADPEAGHAGSVTIEY